MKIDARSVPLPLRGPFGHAFERGDLGKREAAEKPEVHYFGEGGLRHCEFVERVADWNQLPIINGILDFCMEGGDLEQATSLLSPAAARVIDD